MGETHLAVASGPPGHREWPGGLLRPRAYDLMEDLRKARVEHNLEVGGCGSTCRPRCWWWTQFGIWPYDRESATAFSTLVSALVRTGNAASSWTSNKGFGEWGEAFGRHRHRLGCAGPAAAPQPRAEHPRGELQAEGETPSGAVPVATASQPLRRRRPATTTGTDKVADQNQVGQF